MNMTCKESKRFLSAIFYGAGVSGSCHLQIIWDSEINKYYLDGYVDKERVSIEFTEIQARYLQDFKWEDEFDVLCSKVRNFQTESASSSTSDTNKTSMFATQLSESINLNYRFQLKRVDTTKILIELVRGETSKRKTNARLLSLRDFFNQKLKENNLENKVRLEICIDSGNNTKIDMFYIDCDNQETANQVAKLIKQAGGDYIRESLTHGFFGTTNEAVSSTSESEYSVQCALQ